MIRLYMTLVVSIRLYGCETEKVYQGDYKLINLFHNNSLRRVFKITWQEHVNTVELQNPVENALVSRYGKEDESSSATF